MLRLLIFLLLIVLKLLFIPCSLTFEKAAELRRQKDEKSDEVKTLEATTPEAIWLADLDAIDEALNERDMDIAAEMKKEVNAQSKNKAQQTKKKATAAKKAKKAAKKKDEVSKLDDFEQLFISLAHTIISHHLILSGTLTLRNLIRMMTLW